MNLYRYWKTIVSSWVLISATTLVGVVGFGVMSFLQTPLYSASASVFLSVTGGDSTSQLVQGSAFAQQQVRSYALIVKEPIVLQGVIDSLQLPETASQLSRSISTNVPLETSILEITATSESPEEAAAIANATALQMETAVSQLTPSSGGSNAGVLKATTVAPAQVPAFPSSPNRKLDVAIGFVLGLAVGVGFALVRSLADVRVRNTDVVAELTDLPVVGDVLDDPGTNTSAFASQDQDDPRSEAFRKLAANFEFLNYKRTIKTVIVTSPMHNEGKSVTAANLASALALQMRVILVDADLRDPSVSVLTGLPNDKGLTTVLSGRDTVADALQSTGSRGLQVLAAGIAPPNSAELLGSSDVQKLLVELGELCDLVVIDTPPVLPASDTPVLAKLVDGVLVVANANKTKRDQLTETVAQLSLAGGKIIGIVLNQTKSRSKRIQIDALTSRR